MKLELRGITKRFPGVLANDNISLKVGDEAPDFALLTAVAAALENPTSSRRVGDRHSTFAEIPLGIFSGFESLSFPTSRSLGAHP